VVICCTVIGGGCGAISSLDKEEDMTKRIFFGIQNSVIGSCIGAVVGLSSPLLLPVAICTGTLNIFYEGYLYIFPKKN